MKMRSTLNAAMLNGYPIVQDDFANRRDCTDDNLDGTPHKITAVPSNSGCIVLN